jgi:O-antigen/teichoic acid export membrane protein
MSRLKNFSRNLATSYLQLGVNVVYSLVSVPLILHWLPKEEFGMWVVLVQLMTYVSIVDLGMTSATARLLVDHKDDRSSGGYGSLVKTAFLVSGVQGLIICVTVLLGAPLLTELINIPPEHQHTFTLLLRIQGVFAAVGFCLRPIGLMLYAHQRMDLQSYTEIFILVSQLGLLLLFLSRGCGIYSFIYANASTLLAGPIFLLWNCRRLRFLPKAGEWGQASWNTFKEVFNYGKDVFLMNIGAQLQMASQTIVVSRAIGLEAAATWSVGTKMFNLMLPLMTRPNGAALPGMYEMLVRGESECLKKRFRNLVLLTASMGAFLSVSFAFCNHLFIDVWMSGKIVWSPVNDVLLGIWLLILSMQTTHCCFVTVTKQIGAMRYILFMEGCCFILLASTCGYRWGIAGMVTTSIFCTLAFSYQYSLRRSQKYFQCRLSELALCWVYPSLKLSTVFSIIAIVVSFFDQSVPVFLRLLIHGMVAGLAGGVLFLRLGFPVEMINEMTARLPRPAARLLQLLTRRQK